MLLREEMAGALAGCAALGELLCLDSVDSTIDECARRAAGGAPGGLVVVAGEQTAGRGRRGRSFESAAGKGLYLSVLLRPRCTLRELLWLTSWTAVAVCDGIWAACGVRPGIKWTNDLVLEGRKLCGILTELGMGEDGGGPDHVILGVGVNISQGEEDFGPAAAPVAVSLAQVLGRDPGRGEVARGVLRALDGMLGEFPRAQEAYLERYRESCLTLGGEVRVLESGGAWEGTAEDIDGDFGLVVRRRDGERVTVRAGEVSVRGLFGYAE